MHIYLASKMAIQRQYVDSGTFLMKTGFTYWDLQLWQSEGNEEILLNATRYYLEKKIWIQISSSSVQIPPISEATVASSLLIDADCS